MGEDGVPVPPPRLHLKFWVLDLTPTLSLARRGSRNGSVIWFKRKGAQRFTQRGAKVFPWRSLRLGGMRFAHATR
jgi:hypothetical protein